MLNFSQNSRCVFLSNFSSLRNVSLLLDLLLTLVPLLAISDIHDLQKVPDNLLPESQRKDDVMCNQLNAQT